MSLLWLKNVPWATILANAPGLVDGAKKLAAAMRSKPAPAGTENLTDAGETDDPPVRLLRLEQQQRAAAELLRSLADQNAEMARALEALHKRAKLNLRVALVALAAAVATLLWNVLH